jgi:hypothetical protein
VFEKWALLFDEGRGRSLSQLSSLCSLGKDRVNLRQSVAIETQNISSGFKISILYTKYLTIVLLSRIVYSVTTLHYRRKHRRLLLPYCGSIVIN